MSKRFVRILCFAGVFGLLSSAFGENDPQFTAANQEYAAGHFKEAVDRYEQPVRSGQWSANLFYDLGNAYFHTGDFGRAILNYERALQLDRHHPEAQANLRLAREEARALEITPSRTDRLVAFADVNQYAIAAAIAFWIALFCFTIWVLRRRNSGRVLALAIFASAVCACGITAIFLLQNGNTGRGLAIITAGNVTARLATADNSQTVLPLPAGSEINVVSKRGDWIFATLPNALRGWIPAKDAESVRL